MTKQDLILEALIDINAVAAGDLPESATLTFASNRLDRIYDNWNAEPDAVWGVSFSTFTLTPNLQPHTIGPNGATLSAAQRPVEILGANIILGAGTSAVWSRLEIRDDAWWLAKTVRNITSTLPTDLYYSPDWPVGSVPVSALTTPNTNGSIFLWPVPTVAYTLEIMVRLIMAQTTLLQLFSLPPGYRDALTCTLSEECCKPLTGQDPSPKLVTAAAKARARIFDNNTTPPRLATADAGMPGASSPVNGGNYKTGWMR